jgi:CheY-like chemotaxis protein
MNDQPARILMFEDNVPDVYLLREALKAAGVQFQLTHISDGEQAIQFLSAAGAGRAAAPDLVLLDLNLPKIDGHALLERIRGNERLERIPVVVFTASESPRDRQEMAALGVDHYLTKPPDLEQFMQVGEMIRQLLEKERRS